MEFSTNTDLFADAVKRVLPACASKLSIPILGNVQLEVLHNTLIITATDLEVRMAYYLVLEDDSAINGSITVPGKLLQALVAKMGDDKPMRLRTDDERHHVHISVGTADYTLYGLPAEEYPLATMPETIHTLKFPSCKSLGK